MFNINSIGPFVSQLQHVHMWFIHMYYEEYPYSSKEKNQNPSCTLTYMIIQTS
jgi:hypothetical protein